LLAYIVKRTLFTVPTLLAVTAILFIGINMLLGSPALMMLGQDANPAAIAALNAKFGFDRPVFLQYLGWLGNALQGDFGRSYATSESVGAIILAALPVTIELSLWSIFIPAFLAISLNTLPFGRRLLDSLITTVSIAGITIPNFMLGVTLIYLCSVVWGILPSTGWVPWSDGVLIHLRHLVLPVITLSA
jgi:peptide/nickel transport system permease protein